MPGFGSVASGVAGASNIGSAWVTVGAKTAPFVSGMNSATSSLARFTAGVAGIYAAVAAIKATTSEFVNFDRQLRNTSTLVDMTESQLQSVGKQVRAMARQYQVGSAEAQAALYQIYSAVFYGADSMTILEESTKGAAAGLANLFTTVDMVTTVLNAYSMAASESAHVNDLLFTAIRFGKCVRKGTSVILADGRIEKIENLSGGAEVIAFNGESFVPAKARWVDRGTKPIVRVETRLGRRIDTTWNHPYLTETGWKKVSELSAGDKIAVPIYLPFFGKKNVPKEEAGFLGFWIAEGYGGSGSPTMGSNDYGDQIKKWAEYFGCVLTVNTVVNGEHETPVYTIVQKHGNVGSSKNPCTEFLREYGVYDDLAPDKHIPDEVFSWDKESIIEFLYWMFNGDGSLSRHDLANPNKHELKLKSKSEKLIRQVNNLLLRFGIIGRIKEIKYDKKTLARLKKPNNGKIWIWVCTKNFHIRRFIEQIAIDRPCLEEALTVRFRMPDRRVCDKLTYEDAESIRKIYAAGGISQTKLGDLFGVGQQQISKIVTNKRWKNEGLYPKTTELKEHYIFDTIKIIKDVGEDQVYDLIVPKLHNFIAEDIVAHNTTLPELSSQMGRLAGVAAPVNASLEDMIAAVTTLTRQGIMTDWAITSLRQTIMQFIKPTKNLKQAMEDLGFSSASAMFGSLGFAGALREVTKWAEDNNVAMEHMFTNVRAVTAVLPLATSAAKGYAEDQERMANSMGAATVAFEKQTKSWNYQLTKLKTLIGDFAISLGEIIMPALRGLMLLIEKLTDVFRPLISIFKFLGGDILLGIAATTATIGAAIWALTKAFVALKTAILASNAAMAAMKILQVQQAIASGAIIGALGGWQSAATGQFVSITPKLAGTSLFMANLFAAFKQLGFVKSIAALGGIGLSMKAFMNFDLALGEVTGGESVKRGLLSALQIMFGAALAGRILSALFGLTSTAGMLIGAGIGGAAIVFKIILELQEAAAAGQIKAAEAAAYAQKYPYLPEELTSNQPFKRQAQEILRYYEDLEGISWGGEAVEAVINYLETIYERTGDIFSPYKMKAAYSGIAGFQKTLADLGIAFNMGAEDVKDFIDALIETYAQKIEIPVGPISKEYALEFADQYVDSLNKQFGTAISKNALAGIFRSFSESLTKELNTLQSEAASYGLTATRIADITSIFFRAISEPDVIEQLRIYKIGIDTVNDALNSLPKDAGENIKTAILYSIYSNLPEAMKDMFLKSMNLSEQGFSDFWKTLWQNVQARTDGEDVITETIASQFQAAKQNWETLKSSLSDSNITTEEAQEKWSELSSIESTWSTIAKIAAAAGWESADAIAAVVKEWSAFLEVTATETWSSQISSLISIMNDASSSAMARADAEQELASMYSKLESIAETTSLPEVREKALAAMNTIISAGINVGIIADTWASQISSLVSIMNDATIAANQRAVAEQSLASLYSQLEAIAETTSIDEVRNRALEAMELISRAGINVSEVIITWTKQIADLSEIMLDVNKAEGERAAAEQSLISLYSQLESIYKTTSIPAIQSAALDAMNTIIALGINLSETIDSWESEISLLAKTMNDATRTTRERAEAEQNLASLYSQLESIAETTSIQEIRNNALAAMQIILGLGINVSEVSATWRSEISKLLSVMQDATKTASTRASAEQSLVSLYAQLESIAETTSIPEIYAAAVSAMQAIAGSGVKITSATKSWATQIDELILQMNDADLSMEKRIEAEEALVQLYDTLSSKAEDLEGTPLEGFINLLLDLISTIEAAGIGGGSAFERAIKNITAGLPVNIIFEQLQGLFEEFPEHLEDIANYGNELVASYRNQADALRMLAGEDETLIARADALEQKAAALDAAFGRLKDAVNEFQTTLNNIQLSNLSGSLESLTQDMVNSLMGLGGDTPWQDAAQTIGFVAETSGAIQSLGEQFQQLANGPLGESNPLFRQWADEIDGFLELFGKTDEELAQDREEAQRKAEQDAREAAAAAQEAFRQQFKEPILAGIRTGDWKTALETIVGFAAGKDSLMEFARNLSSANDVVIDEQEVIGLITGSFGDLQSAVGSMITIGRLAGQDVKPLEDFKQSLEDLLDPLGALKAKIREILGIGETKPAIAAGQLRELLDIMLGNVPHMQKGGTVLSGGLAALHTGETIIPSGDYFTPGIGGVSSMSQDEILEFQDAVKRATEEIIALSEPIETLSLGMVDLSDSVPYSQEAFEQALSDSGGAVQECSDEICSLVNDAGEAICTTCQQQANALESAGETICTSCQRQAVALDDNAAALQENNAVIEESAAIIGEQTSDIANFFADLGGDISGAGTVVTEFSEALSEGNIGKLRQILEEAVPGSDAWDLVIDAANNLIGSQEQLISDYELLGLAAGGLEQSLLEIQAALKGMTVAAMKWADFTIDLANTIKDKIRNALRDLISSFFNVTTAADEMSGSLNVPTGYKVARAAWAAATPGEPGVAMGGVGGEGFDFAAWMVDLAASIVEAIALALYDFAWENFIENLDWAGFIQNVIWEDFIIGFLWEDVIKPFVWEPIIQPAIDAIAGFVASIMSGNATIGGFLGAVVGLTTLLIALGAVIGTVEAVLAFLWGAIQGVGDSLKSFFKPIIEAVGWAWKALTPLIDGARTLFSSLSPILEIFGETIAFGIKLVTPLFSILGTVLQFLGGIIRIVADGIKWIWDNTLGGALRAISLAIGFVANILVGFYNVIASILNFLDPFGNPFKKLTPIDLPSLQSGGQLLTSGIVYGHAGEIMAPASVASLGAGLGYGGQIIDNTILLDGDVLYSGMKRVNRKEQLRRTGSSVGSRAWENA